MRLLLCRDQKGVEVNTLYLLSCVSKKQPITIENNLTKLYPAGELYLSDWFLKAKAYVTQEGELDEDYSDDGRRLWGVISARFGFLEPTDLVAPYNETLLEKSKAERWEWAKKTFQQLKPYIERNDVAKVVFFAGVAYRTHLRGLVDELFNHHEECTEAPLRNKGIGEQLRYFKTKTNKG